MTQDEEHRNIEAYLHSALISVKDRPVAEIGICTSVSRWLSERGLSTTLCDNLLDWLFSQWPEFSGDANYPVCTWKPTNVGADPTTFIARRQYNMAATDRSMWLGEYGRARMRLLDFLIERTKPE